MAEFLKAKTSTFVNKPMGVIDTRTGGADVGNALAKLGNQISTMAFQDAVIDQKKAGADYVGSLQTRDSDGNLKFEPLPQSLSQVAKEAASPLLRKRYANDLQLDASKKLNDLHLKYKDDPEAFESQSNLYISETIKTLKDNGYGEYTGEYASNATGLMVQHSNKLKMDVYKKQEEVANEKERIIVDDYINESYELRKSGKAQDADAIDKVNKDILDALIERDAVNSPYYKEKKDLIVTNSRQAIIENTLTKFQGNKFAMSAYDRSLALGSIQTNQDRNILSKYGINDNHFKAIRNKLNITQVKKLSAFVATTEGKFAGGNAATSKRLNVQNEGVAIKNGMGNDSKLADSFYGDQLGFGRDMQANDLALLNKPTISNILQDVKRNHVVPNSILDFVNKPSVVTTQVNNAIQQGKPELAKSIIENYTNVAKVIAGKTKVKGLEVHKAATVDKLMNGGIGAVEAYQSVHRPIEEQNAINIEVKNKVMAHDTTIKETTYSLKDFLKRTVNKMDLDLDAFETNAVIPLLKFGLEVRNQSVEDAISSVKETVERIYKEHETNFNFFDREKGGKDRGGLASYYEGDTLETVIKLFQNKINSSYLAEDIILGENGFLLPDRSNGTTGSGRWTLVNEDGQPIMEEFGEIEFTTKEVDSKLHAKRTQDIIDAREEALLNKGWWANTGKKLLDWYASGYSTGSTLGSPPIKGPVTDENFVADTSLETMSQVATDATNLTESSVDIVEPAPTRSPLLDNIVGVSDDVGNFAVDTGEKFVRNLEIVSEKSVEIQNKFFDALKKEGSELLRAVTDSLGQTDIINEDKLNEIIYSSEAKRPIQVHVKASDFIMVEEGFNPFQYPDGAGNSIGHGIAISSLEPDERAMIKDINKITDKESKAIVSLKVTKIVNKFMRDVPDWDTINTDRQIGLISFAYQLGYENVTAQGVEAKRQWPKFFDFLKRAAKEPQGSDSRDMLFGQVRDHMIHNYSPEGAKYTTWFTQTPNRAKKVAQLVRGY